MRVSPQIHPAFKQDLMIGRGSDAMDLYCFPMLSVFLKHDHVES